MVAPARADAPMVAPARADAPGLPTAFYRFGNFWAVPPDTPCTGWKASAAGWENRYSQNTSAPLGADRGEARPDRSAAAAAAVYRPAALRRSAAVRSPAPP